VVVRHLPGSRAGLTARGWRDPARAGSRQPGQATPFRRQCRGCEVPATPIARVTIPVLDAARNNRRVQSGLFLPPFDELAEPRTVATLAAVAEQAGWDGFFLWDHILSEPGLPVADAWTTMAAVATATNRIRFGAMVTPLARRRPWTLARQIATLDHLSGGRLVAGIGLGDDGWEEFSAFGEETSPRGRAELLDESLDILQVLLAGDALRYHGNRLVVDCPPLLPRPVQDPMPIWAACRWPYRKPLARAARVQGCFPIFGGTGPLSFGPGDVTALRAELARHGAPPSQDIVVCGATRLVSEARRADFIEGMREAGVTWLLESFSPGVRVAEVAATIEAGPHGA
jgi:alkanesulfonate monooxygenase SsuD/methylene tetrahydromethanopterin reductase-like flavin-dependent oxidoreductase (luciferase family)